MSSSWLFVLFLCLLPLGAVLIYLYNRGQNR